LQAVANIDTRGADLDADAAVNAVPLARRLVILSFFPGAPGIAPFRIVGNDQGVRVKHHALEAGVGAHVFAYLLPHEPGHEVGKTGVEENPEGFPGAQVQGLQFAQELIHGGEIAHEGEAGVEGENDPQGVFGELLAHLGAGHGGLVQLHTGVPVPFHHAFDPHENFRVDRLGTGVTAEQPSGHGGDQEEAVGRDHAQNGQVDDVLGPENQAEEVELPFHQVKQNGLAAIPLQPGAAVENRLGDENHHPAPVSEQPADGLGVDFPVLLVQGASGVRCGWTRIRLAHGFFPWKTRLVIMKSMA